MLRVIVRESVPVIIQALFNLASIIAGCKDCLIPNAPIICRQEAWRATKGPAKHPLEEEEELLSPQRTSIVTTSNSSSIARSPIFNHLSHLYLAVPNVTKFFRYFFRKLAKHFGQNCIFNFLLISQSSDKFNRPREVSH